MKSLIINGKMALVGSEAKIGPEYLNLSVSKGRAAQWSRWK
jgi:hypothetical protein